MTVRISIRGNPFFHGFSFLSFLRTARPFRFILLSLKGMNEMTQEVRGLMSEGNIWKQLILFSVPLVLGNIFQQLYNAVDSMIVGNFVGKEAILNCKKEYVRVGAFALKGIVREHSDVYVGDEKVGTVTSGTFAPTLKKAVCMLRIKQDAVGKNLEADVRGRRVALELTQLPFYKREK